MLVSSTRGRIEPKPSWLQFLMQRYVQLALSLYIYIYIYAPGRICLRVHLSRMRRNESLSAEPALVPVVQEVSFFVFVKFFGSTYERHCYTGTLTISCPLHGLVQQIPSWEIKNRSTVEVIPKILSKAKFITAMMAAKVSSTGKGSQFSKWQPKISVKTYTETFLGYFCWWECPGHKNVFL
jgi:hypothetical protein